MDWAPGGTIPGTFCQKRGDFWLRCCDFPGVFSKKIHPLFFDTTVDGSEIPNDHLGYINLVFLWDKLPT